MIRTIEYMFLPLVPENEPSDVEAHVDAPADEEAIGQHWGAAVHIPIAVPTNQRTGIELTFQPANILLNI